MAWIDELFDGFEGRFDNSWVEWCAEVWPYTFLISLIYIISIFPLRKWMEPREPMKLRGLLVMWNMIIGAFSIVGAVRVLPTLFYSFNEGGIYASLCYNKYFSREFVGIWGYLFVLSKVPELIDTLFIILRKQKLIFLHWYHHAITLIFAWRMYGKSSSVAHWFCTMNYCVHSLMYTYYAIRAGGFRINRKIAMVVTTLQLAQMFVGIFAVLFAVYQLSIGRECETQKPELALGVAVYTSFMVLFANFFYQTYINPARGRKSRDAVADDKKVIELNGNSAKHDVMNGKGDHLMNGNGHTARLRQTTAQ